MTDLLTITLNPTLDLSATTGHVVAGTKLRLDEPTAEPGGGGINVARAAQAMGGRARAVAALGGTTGARIRHLIEASGLPLAVFRLTEESRQSLAVIDRGTGQQYRFVMPGPQWTAQMVAELLSRLADDVRRMGAGAVVVLSGSQPPGVGPEFPQALAARIPQARLIVDTSGEALRRLVEAPLATAKPHVLRMDRSESEDLAGHPLPDAIASADFAQGLVRAGVADCVVLARGAEGSVLATRTDRLHCTPPRVPVSSAVGAGDSFVAGFALALARGQPMAEALTLGTAAAAATMMTPGTELCRGADVAQLLGQCHVDVVPGPAS